MGDRRCDNAISKTRLCLCRTEPPSGARSGGNPLSPRHYFLIVFRINFHAKLSRVLRHVDCKKSKDQKHASSAKRRPSRETAYASWLWQLPHHLSPEGQLRFRGSHLQRTCLETGQRAEAWKNNINRLKNVRTSTSKASTATNVTTRQ